MITKPLLRENQFLRLLFQEAVSAAKPENFISKNLPQPTNGKTVVVGCGKAAATMAACLEKEWVGDLSGVVVTMYGHTVPTKHIIVREAGHPVPDENGLAAAKEILNLASSLKKNDLMIFLVSGGGSALLPLPPKGISLDEKRGVNTQLLRSGADIFEMNNVRKHLSGIKGGRLAIAAYPAKVVTLALSDIPGDDPAIIASGPTVPDLSTSLDAIQILNKYQIKVSRNIMRHLKSNSSETPKPDDPKFTGNEIKVIATPQKSLDAAADFSKKESISPIILSNQICGESREVALVHGAIAKQIQKYNQPISPPCVILSGGETTVTLKGNGRGGRNLEFLLSLAIYLDGNPRIWALAADTDGIDGTESNAGAILKPNLLEIANVKGLNAKQMLQENDAYSFFSQVNSLIITGPTMTNVNDFRAILVL